MIEILQSAGPNTVQDFGRSGTLRWGVGPAGAMDRMSLRLGNLLLGNAAQAAGLEVAMFPFRLRAHEDCVLAVTGAAGCARLDSTALPPDWATPAHAGQELVIEPTSGGVFAYVCVSGGIEVPEVLGARSTDLKSGFGGVEGRPLRPGDRLQFRKGGSLTMAAAGSGLAASAGGRHHCDPTRLRFLPAAEWEAFAAAQELFLSSDWTVGREMNRQGYKLLGPELHPDRSRELLSHGIVPGVIQLPPSGQPIVQMVEANTAGGYPKLGVIIDVDLPLLAQCRPGRRVRFECVDWTAAMAARAAQEREVAALTLALSAMRNLS